MMAQHMVAPPHDVHGMQQANQAMNVATKGIGLAVGIVIGVTVLLIVVGAVVGLLVFAGAR